ncbi:hypothetical protein [Actinophytocola sp.]|uniref:hypothetical protein n=1 Tax=Actinophytocola sp. TaxID=1872138 RepID=UPI002D8024EF|nr:hypothetical protein [Actinophytocola sp.]HET9144186.1 hypothetical protein [Actinophytocola sp.]
MRLVREVTGVVLILVGIVGATLYLILVEGFLVALAAYAGVALAALGRWLASGSPADLEGETERDFEPDGEGPLYVDPEDPQAFIPRQ